MKSGKFIQSLPLGVTITIVSEGGRAKTCAQLRLSNGRWVTINKDVIVNSRFPTLSNAKISTPFSWYVVGFCVVAMMASGCKSINPSAPPVATPADTSSTYKVILAGNRKPQIYTGKLDKPVTVQQALVESGATRKYKEMTIKIARRLPGSSEILRMPATFDSDAGSVMEETNYAIHPGDEILVKPGSSGILDMVGLTH